MAGSRAQDIGKMELAWTSSVDTGHAFATGIAVVTH